jgi:hypothetical protein
VSFVPTTARDIVKPLQFVEEGTTAATYGTTPTSPTWTAAGINVEITLDPNIVSEKIRALGSEDYADSVKTQENYAFSLKSRMLNTTLAKYGIQAASGTGTIGAHLSFLYSKYIDGTEYYTRMVGCKPISTTISVNRGLWELDMTFHCQEIKDETTSGVAGSTYITAIPSGSPLTHYDQASPFTWNSASFMDRSFSLSVTRDLSLLEINGAVLVQGARAALRNISWTAEVYKKSAALLTDHYDQAERTFTYKIGGSETITLTNARITGYRESHSGSSSDPAVESLSGEASAVAIA